MSVSWGLGRAYDAVPIAAGVGIRLRDAGGITLICTGADTFTITAAPTLSGSYASPGNIITTYFQAGATDGTAAWTKVTQEASNAVVQSNAGYTTVIEVPSVSLPDPDVYIKCSVGGSGLVTAIVHDLDVQRRPSNLPPLSA